MVPEALTPEQMEYFASRVDVSREELFEAFECHKKMVQATLDDGGNEGYAPHLQIICDTGKERQMVLAVIAVAFNEYEEKVAVMENLAGELWEKRLVPVAAILSSECWLSRQKREGHHVQPRHDPERKEGIMLACTSFFGTKRAFMQTCLITRASDNTMLAGEFDSLIEDGVDGAKFEPRILFGLVQGYVKAVRRNLSPS